MDGIVLLGIVFLLVPIIYFLYFWLNSDILEDNEVMKLAISRRFWEIFNYLGFADLIIEINKDFKASLNTFGKIYHCDEPLWKFPSTSAALLKGKKHEWIIYAFAKDNKVFSFYANKGNDNESVYSYLSTDQIIQIAIIEQADIVLQFHNHPNAVLQPSQQDLLTNNNIGQSFTDNNISYFAFVCGRGIYHQYGWWISKSFFDINSIIENILSENGTSRQNNFKLRKELSKKESFKDLKLNQYSTHNLVEASFIRIESNSCIDVD